MKKDILTLLDLDRDDFDRLFQRAAELKERHRLGIVETPLAGKTLGLLFDKASTRTRVSLEAAMARLGGTSLFISAADTQMSRNEPLEDTARVLSRYLDGVAIRTYSQDWIEAFAGSAEIPVINALTDQYHPTQILSDLLTVVEKKGGYENLKIAWVGDGNNVAHSWIHAAGVLGLNLVLACPEGYFPDRQVIENSEKIGGRIHVVTDPKEAVKGADVVNTDVWASMGQEAEQAERIKVFRPYQVNKDLMKYAAPDAIVMHCLPAHRGEEISEAVLEGSHSVVWDQAENKMHMAAAILEALMTGKAHRA